MHNDACGCLWYPGTNKNNMCFKLVKKQIYLVCVRNSVCRNGGSIVADTNHHVIVRLNNHSSDTTCNS